MTPVPQTEQLISRFNTPLTRVILLTAIIAGTIGYSIGTMTMSSSQSPLPQQAITPSISLPKPTLYGDDGDIDYSDISGTVTTDTDYYDQVTIIIDSVKNDVLTRADYDTRTITKPQPKIAYPFSFSRLLPGLTYNISFFACHYNRNNTMFCNTTPKIVHCSGKIQASSCIIQDSGNVDFFLSKMLAK